MTTASTILSIGMVWLAFAGIAPSGHTTNAAEVSAKRRAGEETARNELPEYITEETRKHVEEFRASVIKQLKGSLEDQQITRKHIGDLNKLLEGFCAATKQQEYHARLDEAGAKLAHDYEQSDIQNDNEYTNHVVAEKAMLKKKITALKKEEKRLSRIESAVVVLQAQLLKMEQRMSELSDVLSQKEISMLLKQRLKPILAGWEQMDVGCSEGAVQVPENASNEMRNIFAGLNLAAFSSNKQRLRLVADIHDAWNASSPPFQNAIANEIGVYLNRMALHVSDNAYLYDEGIRFKSQRMRLEREYMKLLTAIEDLMNHPVMIDAAWVKKSRLKEKTETTKGPMT